MMNNKIYRSVMVFLVVGIAVIVILIFSLPALLVGFFITLNLLLGAAAGRSGAGLLGAHGAPSTTAPRGYLGRCGPARLERPIILSFREE